MRYFRGVLRRGWLWRGIEILAWNQILAWKCHLLAGFWRGRFSGSVLRLLARRGTLGSLTNLLAGLLASVVVGCVALVRGRVLLCVGGAKFSKIISSSQQAKEHRHVNGLMRPDFFREF